MPLQAITQNNPIANPHWPLEQQNQPRNKITDYRLQPKTDTDRQSPGNDRKILPLHS